MRIAIRFFSPGNGLQYAFVIDVRGLPYFFINCCGLELPRRLSLCPNFMEYANSLGFMRYPFRSKAKGYAILEGRIDARLNHLKESNSITTPTIVTTKPPKANNPAPELPNMKMKP